MARFLRGINRIQDIEEDLVGAHRGYETVACTSRSYARMRRHTNERSDSAGLGPTG